MAGNYVALKTENKGLLSFYPVVRTSAVLKENNVNVEAKPLFLPLPFISSGLVALMLPSDKRISALGLMVYPLH